MYFVWLATMMSGSVLLEVLLGNAGVSFPLTLTSGFYFAVTVPWRQASLPLMAAALAMECLRLHVLPVYLLSMPALLLAGSLARRFGDPGSLVSRPLSGLAVGLVWLLFLLGDLACQGCPASRRALRQGVCQLALQPLVFWGIQTAFDLQAELLDLRKWTEVSRHDLRGLDKDTAP